MRMVDSQMVSEPRRRQSGARMGRLGLLVAAALLAAALVGSATRSITVGVAKESDQQVSGAGKTIIEGGTGAPSYIPVTTVLAFHANGQGGDFECLALAPTAVLGTSDAAESGQFEVNAMYVTGKVTSLQVSGGTAVLKGTAVITGLGAGPSQAFTFTVRAGGPGTTATLVVTGTGIASPLIFHEILLEGQVKVD
jgi:hypothetical protein